MLIDLLESSKAIGLCPMGKFPKYIYIFYLPTLNIIYFVEKICLRFCLCIFERLTLLKVIVLSRILGK